MRRMKRSNADDAWRVEHEAGVLLDWSLAPEVVKRVADECNNEGVPTMICMDQYLGWVVLCTAGQGPCFAYVEHEDAPEEPEVG